MTEPDATGAPPSSATSADETPPAGLLALFGSITDGPTDLAERHDDYIREYLRERNRSWHDE
jgi:hypothetical protein